MNHQDYYATHIAPKLEALARECLDNGLSLAVACEWAPGEYGHIVAKQAETGFAFKLVDGAAQANGNVDSLFFAIQKHAREHGHSSLVLSQMGVPATPAPSEEPASKPDSSESASCT